MKTYVTRSLAVDAIQYNGENINEIKSFVGDKYYRVNGDLEIWLTDHWGIIHSGWWVHKDTVTRRLGLSSPAAFERFFREYHEESL